MNQFVVLGICLAITAVLLHLNRLVYKSLVRRYSEESVENLIDTCGMTEQEARETVAQWNADLGL